MVGIIGDVYVYPDFNGRDWRAIVAKYRAQIESGLSTEEFYTAVQTMVEELGDEHSRFDSPAGVAHTSHAGTRDFCAYNHLAQVLPEQGVAVFIFDRRGCGESSGSFETATFYDLADDVKAVVATLKMREDIDEERIGLWGMSQGGWIAPLAASESDDVKFVVAVSASAVLPVEQMNYSSICSLRLNGFSEDVVDEMLPENAGESKWRQQMDFSPIPSMRKIKVPVILVFGETDPWIFIEQSIELWKKFGLKDLSIHQVANANHFMVSIAEHGIEEDTGAIVDEYTRILCDWLARKTIKQKI